MRRWTWLICGGLLLGSTTIASADTADPYPACTKTPTKGDQEAAEGAFKAGFGSYQEGDYSKAIMYWTDAYQRDCTAHALLLNLANAHERMGNKKEAVRALKTYLERAEEVPNRTQLERRVENLEAQIAAEAPATKPDDTPKPLPGDPQPDPSEDGGVKVDSSGGKSIAPWIVVGVGGALSVVGGLVYVGGKNKVDDADAICPDRENCPTTEAGKAAKADGNDGRNQMTLGGAMVGVGLAGVAGGLAWHFFFDNPEPESEAAASPSTTLQPTLGPSYAGISLGGSF